MRFAALAFGLATALLVVAPPQLPLEEVVVGGTVVRIPTPERGYLPTRRSAPALLAFSKSLITADVDLLELFVTTEDMARHLKEESPLLRRYMMVQVVRSVKATLFSNKDCATIKAGLKQQFGTIVEEQRDKISRILSSKSAVSDIGLPNVVPLGFCHETASSLVVLMLAKITNRASPDPRPRVMVAAAGFCLVKGKLVQLNVYSRYGAREDIDWVNVAVGNWLSDVVRAN